MENTIINFDITQIKKIEYKKTAPTSYRWYYKEPRITKWFGLEVVQSFKKSGWAACSSHRRSTFSELNGGHYSYILIDNIIMLKPVVYVSLGSDSITRRFNSDSEAVKWVDELKLRSNKNFETIII